YLEEMVCPKSKQPLVYFPRGEDDRDERDGFLFCPMSRLRYRIDDGLPVLLVSEATEVSPTDAQRLEARAQALGIATDARHRGA
ncbi:MAG TPA: Trm112 family protein, partial [Kofleriaceae bacterium]|nr:Trm112 family protein [Kofleriaceae bacterium]